MPKRKVRLRVRLPLYREPKTTMGSARPGMTWRRAVFAAIMKAASDHEIEKYEGVDLECEVIEYQVGLALRQAPVKNPRYDALVAD